MSGHPDLSPDVADFFPGARINEAEMFRAAMRHTLMPVTGQLAVNTAVLTLNSACGGDNTMIARGVGLAPSQVEELRADMAALRHGRLSDVPARQEALEQKCQAYGLTL